jgi:hypothetical protein
MNCFDDILKQFTIVSSSLTVSLRFISTVQIGIVTICSRSRVSSGIIVSDYELDDRAIWVRPPAGAKGFYSILCVQTSSGAHPASCPMGTGGTSPGVNRGRGVRLTTNPHLVPRS